jgi:hypothetical protein
VNRKGNCYLNQTRLEGVDYIERERKFISQLWHPLDIFQGQGGVAHIELLGQANFVLNTPTHLPSFLRSPFFSEWVDIPIPSFSHLDLFWRLYIHTSDHILL